MNPLVVIGLFFLVVRLFGSKPAQGALPRREGQARITAEAVQGMRRARRAQVAGVSIANGRRAGKVGGIGSSRGGGGGGGGGKGELE